MLANLFPLATKLFKSINLSDYAKPQLEVNAWLNGMIKILGNLLINYFGMRSTLAHHHTKHCILKVLKVVTLKEKRL